MTQGNYGEEIAMLVAFARLDGEAVALKAEEVSLVRPASGDSEPAGSVRISYGFSPGQEQRVLFTTEAFDAVLGKLDAALDFARLTAPNNVPVAIDAHKILDISPPTDTQYPEGTKAVVTFGRHHQAVRETVAQAADIVAAALGG